MIIQTPDRTLESNGLQDQGSFNIKTSPAAFLMLSSGLYTNKIKAVLREIGCNALDAHKMNGNEHVPIEVKLPNKLDRQFYIKDFGPGLSHEQVMKLYTTYFESSKQNSDDFIGGFGVGSKSPFAYTDTFTVESRHNGMKRVYTAYVGSNGIPAIAKLMEEETTEENGLSVGFPVRDSDVAAFEEESVLVFSWFEPRPNVIGRHLDWSRADAKEQLGDVTVFDHGNVPGNYNSSVLRMGGVAYPMGDFWRQYEQTFGQACDPAVSALRHFPVAFNVPIGTSNVAASREALQFDKGSLERIHAALLPIATEFSSQIVERLTKPKRFFERMDFARKWFDKVNWSQERVRQLLSATRFDAKLDSVIETAYSSTIKIDPSQYPSISFVRMDSNLQEGMYKLTQRRTFAGLAKYAGLQSMRRKLTNHLGPSENPNANAKRTTAWDPIDRVFGWKMGDTTAHLYNHELPDMMDETKTTKDAWPFIYHLITNGEIESDGHRRIWFTPAPGASHDAFMAEVTALSDELGLQPRSYLTKPEPAREVNARPPKVLLGLCADSAHSDAVKKFARGGAERIRLGTELPTEEPIMCILYEKKAANTYARSHLVRVVQDHQLITKGYTWKQFAELTGLPEQEQIYFVAQEDWEDIQAANPEAMNWAEVKEALKNDPVSYNKVFQETNKPAGEEIEYPMSLWLQSWRKLTPPEDAQDKTHPLAGTVYGDIMERWNMEASASSDYQRAMRLRREANELVGWNLPTGVPLNRNADYKLLCAEYPLLEHAIRNAPAEAIAQYVQDRDLLKVIRDTQLAMEGDEAGLLYTDPTMSM